jgi:hypothetical protein
MDPVTIEHRKQELRTLLGQLQAHPSQEWPGVRRRVVVLRQMVSAAERQQSSAAKRH